MFPRKHDDDDGDEKDDDDDSDDEYLRQVFVAVYDERPKCQIERRKRNLKFTSPVSRREREI